jgi:anti-anti-sigma regulatory factor
MEFKIDTKDSFTIIVPINMPIDAKMTGELRKKCVEIRQSGRKNFIVDFGECSILEKSAIQDLIALHEECYGNEESLVFVGVSKPGMSILKEDETDLLINIAPTMKEAVDIVGMEILERDLFSEES